MPTRALRGTMTRVVVIGAGMIGTAVARLAASRGDDVVGTYRSRRPDLQLPMEILDATDRARVADLLRRNGPDAVVLAAAMTSVDACEASPELALLLNGTVPGLLAEECRNRGIRLVHLSTDYVFDGRRGAYTENDPPSPIQVYGRSKLEGERAVFASGADAAVVRLSTPYGVTPRRQNFASWVEQKLSAGEAVKAANDQITSPTYVPDLAEAVQALLRGWRPGLHHLAGAQAISRFDFAVEVANAFGLDAGLLEPVPLRALDMKAPRPLHSDLDSRRATDVLQVTMSDARTGIRKMAEAMGRS